MYSFLSIHVCKKSLTCFIHVFFVCIAGLWERVKQYEFRWYWETSINHVKPNSDNISTYDILKSLIKFSSWWDIVWLQTWRYMEVHKHQCNTVIYLCYWYSLYIDREREWGALYTMYPVWWPTLSSGYIEHYTCDNDTHTNSLIGAILARNGRS